MSQPSGSAGLSLRQRQGRKAPGRSRQIRPSNNAHPRRNNHHNSSSSNNNKTSESPHAQAWLDAIQQASNHLRRDAENEGVDNLADLESSLIYLGRIEKILTEMPKRAWKFAPDNDPPEFVRVLEQPSEPILHPDSSTPPETRPAFWSNSFAAFLDSDEEEEDENIHGDHEEEAGDEIVLHRHIKTPPSPGGMDVLRLMVRVSVTQSDLQAHKAFILALSDRREWLEGAICLQYAILHVRKALELADAQISRWYEKQDYLDRKSSFEQQRQQDLAQDADIVHVCIQSLVERREQYLAAAKRKANQLRRRLQPQWESRDQAKTRIGNDRWTQNPRPRNHFAEMRKADEKELLKLEKSLALLESSDTEALQGTAQQLKTRLLSSSNQKKKRYNGQRPTDLSRRVQGFPDATDHGWMFTGSADNLVEFFEKTTDDGILVKLDFYFTTGTIKTSMDHPTNGKTQLFAKNNVTPDLYLQILANPRVHTNVRYQTKRNNRLA